jgi:prepilin peptidase CpaA
MDRSQAKPRKKMTFERRLIMTTTVSTIASAAGFLLFVFAMLSAAVSDLTTYKIRNKLILTLLLAYLVVAPIAGIPGHEMARSVAVACLALLISFALFAAGWIGGGDAKLATVTTLWLGADNAFAYLVLLSLLGGVLAVIVYFFRTSLFPERLAKIGWIARLRSRAEGVELPYGVAITLAGLGVLPSTPWMSEMTWRI